MPPLSGEKKLMFEPNGAVTSKFRKFCVYAERHKLIDEIYVKAITTKSSVVVHGFRGTGKSSTMLDLEKRFSKDFTCVLLDFANVNLNRSSDKYWTDLIEMTLKSIKNTDPTKAKLADSLLAGIEASTSLSDMYEFSALFDPSHPLWTDGKRVVILADEFSKLRDKQDESTTARDNVEQL
jgi:Cdc6-like AAA superfamily ATPase